MAVSSPDPRHQRIACAWLCVPAVLLGLGAAPFVLAQQQEITLEAESSDLDRRNERLLFRQVRISQGDLSIAADEAETRDLDFSRGTWLFRGNVRIDTPMGTIQSARATVTFTDHVLRRATAEGAPARFSRMMPAPENRLVTGTANRIDYDPGRGELELAGQAGLRDGVREVSGGRLVYRIGEDRLIASSDEEGTERVRIVITPPESPPPAPREDEERDDDEAPRP